MRANTVEEFFFIFFELGEKVCAVRVLQKREDSLCTGTARKELLDGGLCLLLLRVVVVVAVVLLSLSVLLLLLLWRGGLRGTLRFRRPRQEKKKKNNDNDNDIIITIVKSLL